MSHLPWDDDLEARLRDLGPSRMPAAVDARVRARIRREGALSPVRPTASREHLTRELWRLQGWEDRLRRWQTALVVWTVAVLLAVLALLTLLPHGGTR